MLTIFMTQFMKITKIYEYEPKIEMISEEKKIIQVHLEGKSYDWRNSKVNMLLLLFHRKNWQSKIRFDYTE